MPPVACDTLRWHRDVQRQEQRRAEAAGTWKGLGLLFCTTGGAPYCRRQAGDALRKVARELDIECATSHTFRHTASALVQDWCQPRHAAQLLLGHASERMTARYSHPSRETMTRVANLMQDLFGDGTAEDNPPPLLTIDEGA